MQNQVSSACKPYLTTFQGNHLLARYPVTLPVILLASAAGVCAASLFASRLFPALAFFGISALPLCLALVFVLGVAGILASIISILERIDRCHLQPADLPGQKGA